jgi:hypothetical protein
VRATLRLWRKKKNPTPIPSADKNIKSPSDIPKSSLKTQWNQQIPSVNIQKQKYNNLKSLGKIPKQQF